ncbi:MAG: DUF4235 domain-containing protein [Propionibacteriaceae bacterium]|nr:DUF4235 domain-containing protein [Propionibacteriaceae bacterium]
MSLKNKIAFGVLGAVAGSVAVKALNGGWTRVTGQEPPDPNDPDVPVVQALAWVVASGLVLAGAQVLVNRFGIRRLQAKVKPVSVHVSRGPAHT